MTAATGRLKMSLTLSMKVRISLNVYVLEEREAAPRLVALKLKKVFVENIHALATRGSSVGKAKIADWRLHRIDSMRRPATSGWIDVRMNGNLERAKSGWNMSSYKWDWAKSLIAEVSADHMDDLCREGEEEVVVIAVKTSST